MVVNKGRQGGLSVISTTRETEAGESQVENWPGLHLSGEANVNVVRMRKASSVIGRGGRKR